MSAKLITLMPIFVMRSNLLPKVSFQGQGFTQGQVERAAAAA
jgi:hypothetical protein